jgi:predicted RNase H-like HicB family nuclease
MEIEIIKCEKTKLYFGFMKEFSGICAQGNSKEEVYCKLDIGFVNYIKHITK